MVTWTDAQLDAEILVSSASEVSGIPLRTLKNWIGNGWLPTIGEQKRGRRVTLRSVLDASKIAFGKTR